MGWLEKLISLNTTTILALSGLALTVAFGFLIYGVVKLLLARGNGKGNGKGNGAALPSALQLDDRVDMLEHQMEQVKTGLGFIKDSVGELGKTTGRLDRETAVLQERVTNLIKQLT